jgi:hypothetical protein
MRGATISLLVLLGLAVAGCNQTSGDTTPIDMGTPPVDGGGDVDAGGDTDAGPICAHVVPTSGFGSHIGTKFADLTLPRCDSGGAGTDYQFYGQDYCTNELTVFTLAAGWCNPCNLESDQLNAQLINPYGPRGVRVVQVLVQDDSFNVPTQSFCNNWISRHHITNDVTVMDPDGLTQIYNPMNSLPATLIVDGDGVIQFRLNGTGVNPADGQADLTEMTACLDKLLSVPRVLCH